MGRVWDQHLANGRIGEGGQRSHDEEVKDPSLVCRINDLRMLVEPYDDRAYTLTVDVSLREIEAAICRSLHGCH